MVFSRNLSRLPLPDQDQTYCTVTGFPRAMLSLQASASNVEFAPSLWVHRMPERSPDFTALMKARSSGLNSRPAQPQMKARVAMLIPPGSAQAQLRATKHAPPAAFSLPHSASAASFDRLSSLSYLNSPTASYANTTALVTKNPSLISLASIRPLVLARLARVSGIRSASTTAL